MAPKEIAEGELLYHAVHGLCRMDRKIEQNQPGDTFFSYALVPKKASKMKIRFVIGVPDMPGSGFHRLVSLEEANRIMEYLKAGNSDTGFASQNETWGLARAVLSVSHHKPEVKEVKDQRKRQMLARSVKGLLGEMAVVFNITLKEAAAKIQKNLGRISEINPMVMTAFEHAVDE